MQRLGGGGRAVSTKNENCLGSLAWLSHFRTYWEIKEGKKNPTFNTGICLVCPEKSRTEQDQDFSYKRAQLYQKEFNCTIW